MTIRPITMPLQVRQLKATKTYESLKVVRPPKTGMLTPTNKSTVKVDGKGKEIDLLA